MKKLHPSLVRQLFMLLLILVIGFLIFMEMMPYLGGVLGAITLFVIFQKWMGRLVKRGWHKIIAAVTLMLISFIGILLPIVGIVLLLGSKVEKAVDNSGRLIQIFKEQLAHVEATYGYDLSAQINTSEITSWISSNLQNVAGGTFEIIIAVSIMYFMLYYMLIHRDTLRKTMEDYIPMTYDNLVLVAKESDDMVKANAIGIPAVSLCQGVIALIGFWIFDVPNPMFWFVITTVGSMVPFAGTLLGFVPLTILLLAQGHTMQGVLVGSYGFFIVGGADNFIRLYILKSLSDVHPLITLIGVVIGVPLFGFIGLIFGPLLISLFLLIVKIYKKEYGESTKKEKTSTNV